MLLFAGGFTAGMRGKLKRRFFNDFVDDAMRSKNVSPLVLVDYRIAGTYSVHGKAD